MAVRALPTGQGPGLVRPRWTRPDPAMPWRGLAPGGLRASPSQRRCRRITKAAPAKAVSLGRARSRRGPRRISGRLLAFCIVIFALMVSYAFPLRVFLSQQSQIARMRAEQAEQRRHIEELSERLARWDDPDYVAAQARSRLHLVRVGELLYVVGVPPATDEGQAASPDVPWFVQVWNSIQAADDSDQ